MTRSDGSNGVIALVHHTANMAELAMNAGHPDRKHNEFLPYPDKVFRESIDERFHQGEKFKLNHIFERRGQTFVPNVPVLVLSISAERTSGGIGDIMNPYLYAITTKHGPYEWTIYRRYRHFQALNKALSQLVENETKQLLTDTENIQDEENENPCFPTRSDRLASINDQSVQERCVILREYLNKVLKHPKFRSHTAMHIFFEVGCVSFVYGLSASVKEGFLSKRSNDDYRGHNLFLRLPFLCDACKFHHGRKWFVIKDSYILYMRHDAWEVRFPMLVDRGFEITRGFRNARTQHGIKITNLQRVLVVKCRNNRECEEWTHHLLSLKKKAKGFVSAAASRFNSFAPIRRKQFAHWFINGKSYMEAVAKALLTAQEEVFITDWWLSPEIMMIRPSENDEFRLDNLLGKIADQGVRVYVMVFKEVSFALGLNSLHTKRALIGKSKNGFIKVIRHPDHYPSSGVFLWSHHEKLVVIDQKIAFVGGIDLCFGRWDDDFMRLVDLGKDNVRTLSKPPRDEASSVNAEQQNELATLKDFVESTRPKVSFDSLERADEKPAGRRDRKQRQRNRDVKDDSNANSKDPTSVKKAANKWIGLKSSIDISANKVRPQTSIQSVESETNNTSGARNQFMRVLTKFDDDKVPKQNGSNIELKPMANWRHSRIPTDVLQQQTSHTSGKKNNADSTNNNAAAATIPSYIFRSHKVFNTLLHPSTISARQEAVDLEQQVLEDDEEAVRSPEMFVRKWRKILKMMKKSEGFDSEDEEIPEPPKPASSTSYPIDRTYRYFIGKDYANSYEKDFNSLEQYDEDFIDRKAVPRMPWHDEALVVFGKVARDVARHFIQRWNIHKCEKFLNDDSYPFLLPKTYEDSDEIQVSDWASFLESRPFEVDAQCVRSTGPWSVGTKIVENSIQNAYVQMIDAAKYLIYIENQFFISIAADGVVRNQLGDALFRRILRAHTLNEKFRIYVVIPLLPGFDNINAVLAVLYFIMRSITKGDQSLFKRLESQGVNPHNFISFFGMRNHDILMGRLVQEIVYVHSKLMIVDDRMAICGSANINDRSLLGQRDSEFCVVINDREEEDGVFDGNRVRVGKFCSSWRKRLFRMMLGILHENPKNISVDDPVSDEFYNYFRQIAKNNARIYEEVFSVIPTDQVRTLIDMASFDTDKILAICDPLKAQEKLKQVQGFIVEYPIYFLDHDDYLPRLGTPEGMVPNIMWT